MEITNFKLPELLVTTSGITNYPSTFEQLRNVLETAEKLQRIRNAFGAGIRVNSCFRSKLVNEAAGGSATSAHLKALAADICAYSGKQQDNRKLLEVVSNMMKELDIDQLIVYHDKACSTNIRFIHVGWRKTGSPRGQVLLK